MSEARDQPEIDTEAPPAAVKENPDGEPVETGVPDSLREAIAGEPGPANEELRAKALDPNEASVDVEDDPAANEEPNLVPAPEDSVEIGDPDAVDTGDQAGVYPDERLDTDPEPDLPDDASDELDDVEDGDVVKINDTEN